MSKPDFPPEWRNIHDLSEGGQAHTFIVQKADGSDTKLYVLKRLKKLKRKDKFDREVKACQSLVHPNILSLVDTGCTPDGTPYFISEYCEGGSLEGKVRFTRALDGLKFFRQILAGIAYAHYRDQPIYHLDLKPANIFLRADTPVIGDFGLCVIDGNGYEFTQEGQLGSRYYCAPELRNPRLAVKISELAAADIYSLGKMLYWLFTGDVFDREDEYADANARLATLFPDQPQFAFVDELIAYSVQPKPEQRVQDVSAFTLDVNGVIQRIEAAGRVLDLSVPMLCLFCGCGHYRPLHEITPLPPYGYGPAFPDFAMREHPPAPNPMQQQLNQYQTLRNLAENQMGVRPGNQIPVYLICDFCGNVQYFRFDLTKDRGGTNWRP